VLIPREVMQNSEAVAFTAGLHPRRYIDDHDGIENESLLGCSVRTRRVAPERSRRASKVPQAVPGGLDGWVQPNAGIVEVDRWFTDRMGIPISSFEQV